MLRQIFGQQICLERQRARSAQIAFLQGRTSALDVVPNLSGHLLLARVQRATRQPFELIVGGAQQAFRVLALADRFSGCHAGRDPLGRLGGSAFANHDFSRSAMRRF